MQSMETTQFMVYARKTDPTSLLILWQPGLAGELSLKRFETTPDKLQVLVDKLARDYPLDHPVILYEAATNPLEKTRMDTVLLRDLPAASLRQATTLAATPCSRRRSACATEVLRRSPIERSCPPSLPGGRAGSNSEGVALASTSTRTRLCR